MKSKYYYTLRDVIEYLTGNDFLSWQDNASDFIKSIMEDEISSSVVGRFSNIGTLSGGTFTFKDYIAEAINNIFEYHQDNFCVFLNNDNLIGGESKKFIMKFLTLLNLTAPRYTTLLSLYSSQATKWLDKITSSSSGLMKFNDTPQGSGDFTDDTHATNVTMNSSSTSVEVKTPIERLKEIQDSYSDVMAKWTTEFEKLFLEGENVYECEE